MQCEKLPDYISRTLKDMNLTNNDVCQLVVLLEAAFIRCKKNINSTDYHALYACALLISMKMYDDNVYDNKYFAKHFRITLHALNNSEVIFLKILNWNVTISVEQYNAKLHMLQKFGNDCTKLIISIFYPNFCKLPLPMRTKQLSFQDGYKREHLRVLYCPLSQDPVVQEEQSMMSFIESLFILLFSID